MCGKMFCFVLFCFGIFSNLVCSTWVAKPTHFALEFTEELQINPTWEDRARKKKD